MKQNLLVIVATFALGTNAFAQYGGEQVAASPSEDAQVTVSMRQNDFALCGQAFYDDVYALTVVFFANGAEHVVLEDYREQVFALVRSSEEFKDNAEAFIDHMKDIPGQLLEIIREDPTVIDSCANFSVALVGPP